VQRNLSKPFKLDNYEVFTSASIGIIVSDEIMREPEDFLRDADAAMYRAKESGKARYEIFDRDMHVRNMNLLQVETDLRHAVERCEFEVLYQPIVKLATGAIHEFEALLRWRHPVHGLIAPDEFVGVAEETGLIIEIGKWILDQACRQIAKWQKNLATELSISVNLSAKQLMHPTLTKQVHHALNTSGLRPQQLKLEVTESNVMEHSEKALSVLRELDELGVMLSTDDFGTGYSSLSYLQRFPFDRLKIDRSFIDRMEEDAKSAAIVKTILMLGENLDIEVVAEGIENERQLAHLRTLGCEYGQGYLFSRPATAFEARGMIRDHFDPDLSRAVLDLSETVLEVTRIQ
jgi:EAL domain-containing protein (putative c-di-GMP-specific phosphodiesterase class I)